MGILSIVHIAWFRTGLPSGRETALIKELAWNGRRSTVVHVRVAALYMNYGEDEWR